MYIIVSILGAASFIRTISIIYSIIQEIKLKREGAKEFLTLNSILLIATCVAIYVTSIFEVLYIQKTQFDVITITGLVLYIFSMFILVLVISGLGGFWSMKVLIASKHVLKVKGIYKYFKHPNYFLNVIPEMIGIGLIAKSFYSTPMLFILLLIILFYRVKKETALMRSVFPEY